MRWNCPHCGTILALSAQSLGSDWFFTKCYKCLGYSMVRAARVEFMKIEQGSRSNVEVESDFSANVMLVNAPELLEAQAQAQQPAAPTKPAPAVTTPLAAAPAQAPAPQAVVSAQPMAPQIIRAKAKKSIVVEDHEALQELSYVSSGSKEEGPKAEFGSLISNSGAEIASSSKVPAPLPEIAGVSQPVKKDGLKNNIQNEMTNELFAKHRKPLLPKRTNRAPATIALLGLLGVGMGAYLYNESQKAISSLTSISSLKSRAQQNAIIDQLHEKVMAPVRPVSSAPQAAPEQKVDKTTTSQAAPLSSQSDSLIITTNAAAVLKDASLEPTSSAKTMKTSNAKAQEAAQNITVELKGDYANLRSGPGMDYPVIGSIKSGAALRVLGWNNNWFKIQAQNEAGESSQAWIRSDLVKGH